MPEQWRSSSEYISVELLTRWRFEEEVEDGYWFIHVCKAWIEKKNKWKWQLTCGGTKLHKLNAILHTHYALMSAAYMHNSLSNPSLQTAGIPFISKNNRKTLLWWMAVRRSVWECGGQEAPPFPWSLPHVPFMLITCAYAVHVCDKLIRCGFIKTCFLPLEERLEPSGFINEEGF